MRVISLLLAGILLTSAPADAVERRGELFSETFTGGSVPVSLWRASSPSRGKSPCLTAAAKTAKGSLPACKRGKKQKPDKSGKGTLRLTDNSRNQSGVLVLDRPVDARAGLRITFDLFTYNARKHNGRGGDGVSFYLVDGATKTVKAGRTGASLGYQGVPGAYLGLGFDAYGNFSNPDYFPPGDIGPGVIPNAVVVRGAGSTGYQYLVGRRTPGKLADDAAKTRDRARRTVVVDVSSTRVMTIKMNFYDGKGMRTVLSKFGIDRYGQPAMPATLKVGFAASTGDATAFHELSRLSIQRLEPDLKLTLDGGKGPVIAGRPVTLTAAVSNALSAGPTSGPVTATFALPSGMTATGADGPGWSCFTKDQRVACNRTDPLQPGLSYPPIKATVRTSPSTDASAPVIASVTVPGESSPADNTAKTLIGVVQNPDLSTVLTARDKTLTAVVSNAPNAGPSHAPTTLTIPIPPATRVESVSPGPGWSCKTTEDTVTCSRREPLPPGKAFPPVVVTLGSIDGAPLDTDATATVATPDDRNPADDLAGPIPLRLPARPPNLSVTITDDGPFRPGESGTYKVKVANAPAGGPTTGPLTITTAIPRHLTAVSASGEAWTCTRPAGKVVCTRPATPPLAAGATAPEITIRVQAPAADATVSATAETDGESDPSDDSAELTTQISS